MISKTNKISSCYRYDVSDYMKIYIYIFDLVIWALVQTVFPKDFIVGMFSLHLNVILFIYISVWLIFVQYNNIFVYVWNLFLITKNFRQIQLGWIIKLYKVNIMCQVR